MEKHSLNAPPPRLTKASIDLADLVSLLVSMDAPSRIADEIVETMLGGEKVSPAINSAAVIAGRWLSEETPAYTAGGQALSVLARRRGYRISTSRDGNGFRAEAWSLSGGAKASASARLEGAAGIAAIVSLTRKETAVA